MGYKEHMMAGFERLLKAADQGNKKFPGIKELAEEMHKHWNEAAYQFSLAANEIPTANVEWSTAIEMMLLVREMQAKHKIPQ